MREIVVNVDNLCEEQMTNFTTKVKILIFNSKNEILLGYSNYEYQFPGGTQEEGEILIDTLKRELMEETGIELKESSLVPFAKSSGYYKDWPQIGRNKKVEIYYYEVRTDEKPNLDRINLTDKEKEGNFCLKYISLNNIEKELKKNALEHGDTHGIVKEMINVLKIYTDFLK